MKSYLFSITDQVCSDYQIDSCTEVIGVGVIIIDGMVNAIFFFFSLETGCDDRRITLQLKMLWRTLFYLVHFIRLKEIQRNL